MVVPNYIREIEAEIDERLEGWSVKTDHEVTVSDDTSTETNFGGNDRRFKTTDEDPELEYVLTDFIIEPEAEVIEVDGGGSYVSMDVDGSVWAQAIRGAPAVQVSDNVNYVGIDQVYSEIEEVMNDYDLEVDIRDNVDDIETAERR